MRLIGIAHAQQSYIKPDAHESRSQEDLTPPFVNLKNYTAKDHRCVTLGEGLDFQ